MYEDANIILPLIVFIVLIIFLGVMMYLLISSNFKSSNPQDPVSSDIRSNTNIKCLPGQCATNLSSGFKSCPPRDVEMIIDPIQSVCNSRFLCDNPLTPFALQSDGSTNINGQCEPGVTCSCLKTAQCPSYILSIFTTSNGNPYQSSAGQRITFPQRNSFVNSNGIQTSIPPIQISDPSRTFCVASSSFLPLSNPGCNFVSAPDGNSMTVEELLLCMGQQSGCSGLQGSPCLQGVLAAISDNPDNITAQNVLQSQFGCVRGKPCPCNQVAIFDTNFGSVICKSL